MEKRHGYPGGQTILKTYCNELIAVSDTKRLMLVRNCSLINHVIVETEKIILHLNLNAEVKFDCTKCIEKLHILKNKIPMTDFFEYEDENKIIEKIETQYQTTYDDFV